MHGQQQNIKFQHLGKWIYA